MSLENDHTIKSLFEQLSKDDANAFTELFYHYNKRLFPFVLKKVKHTSIAEEIIQDIFLKLWVNREHISTLENPEGYLYRIAGNKVLDHFKRLAHEQKMLSNQRQQLLQNVDSINALHRKEIESVVSEAVRQLPAQRKIIYNMRDDGLTYQEIAQKLGLSANTVKNQLVDASKFIRDYLLQKGISPLLIIQIIFY